VPTLAVLHRILENAEEATLYVEEVGMSEMDAIKAATSAAAETLKQPAVGAVEPGRYAGLLVVDSDPLTDINVLLEEPTAVYKSGGLVSTAN
jgi:imidazolonepropionase-like amidohydrolase